MTTHRDKTAKHDYPLLKSLVSSFLAVLVAGLALNASLTFVENRLPPFGSSSSTDEADLNWKHLEYHGDIELHRRPIVGTRLYAHRVVATVDLPTEALVHVFRDTPNSVHWAKDLKESEEFHKSGVHHEESNVQTQKTYLLQRYNVPLPGIQDREFLMTKTMTAVENPDGTHATVAFEYESFEDDEAYPVCDGCVRGENLGSKFTFTALDGGKRTKVEAEVQVDPYVYTLSAFFVNNFQKNWPVVTLHRLEKAVRHHLGRDNDFQMKTVLQSMFPLKR